MQIYRSITYKRDAPKHISVMFTVTFVLKSIECEFIWYWINTNTKHAIFISKLICKLIYIHLNITIAWSIKLGDCGIQACLLWSLITLQGNSLSSYYQRTSKNGMKDTVTPMTGSHEKCLYFEYYTQHKKASNHHANLPLEMYSFTIVTTWETPGNHWCWWPDTLIIARVLVRVIIKVLGHQHQWFPGVSQVVTM